MKKNKKIILGSDHAGFDLKEEIKDYLKKENYKFEDLGIFKKEIVDYPKIALEVAKEVAKQNCKGILFCGTGIGMCIVANKVKGIRAALCYDTETAKVAREHNDSNILCLGGRKTNAKSAKEIVKVWLETEFSKEQRHIRRVNEIKELDK